MGEGRRNGREHKLQTEGWFYSSLITLQTQWIGHIQPLGWLCIYILIIVLLSIFLPHLTLNIFCNPLSHIGVTLGPNVLWFADPSLAQTDIVFGLDYVCCKRHLTGSRALNSCRPEMKPNHAAVSPSSLSHLPFFSSFPFSTSPHHFLSRCLKVILKVFSLKWGEMCLNI